MEVASPHEESLRVKKIKRSLFWRLLFIKKGGYNHQEEINIMIKPPENLLSWSEIVEEFGNFVPDKMKSFLSLERPIDFKPVTIPNPLERRSPSC